MKINFKIQAHLTTTNSFSLPSYEYEIEQNSVSSLTSNSWPQQYPIDPFIISNKQTLTNAILDAFRNMVNAFGGFDYTTCKYRK